MKSRFEKYNGKICGWQIAYAGYLKLNLRYNIGIAVFEEGSILKYVFDIDKLHSIARKGLGLPPEEIFKVIAEELRNQYPGLIDEKRDWIFNNAGGAMGMLTLLYASPREYLLFFGTPIGTEGHSGRYSADVYDFMLDGEMWCYTEGQFERTVFRPGDMAYLGKSRVKGYCVKDHAWMLEYARGCIPLMLPFGLSDSIFSTLDWKNIFRIIGRYAGLSIKHLW